jgi:hypothetical protein
MWCQGRRGQIKGTCNRFHRAAEIIDRILRQEGRKCHENPPVRFVTSKTQENQSCGHSRLGYEARRPVLHLAARQRIHIPDLARDHGHSPVGGLAPSLIYAVAVFRWVGPKAVCWTVRERPINTLGR